VIDRSLSRLVERFLLDNYKPHQLSTYALTLYRHTFTDDKGISIPVGEQGFAALLTRARQPALKNLHGETIIGPPQAICPVQWAAKEGSNVTDRSLTLFMSVLVSSTSPSSALFTCTFSSSNFVAMIGLLLASNAVV
jgi:hypothetical protein